MTARYSTGLRNFTLKYGSLDDALRNGVITIYSGAQPSSADAAPTGTPLCVVSNNAGAVTSEVLAQGSVTLTGGAGGALNTLTVNGVDILGGAVPFDSTLAQTAMDIATQINAFKSKPDYSAVAVGAVVNITAMPGNGASPNGFVVAGTTTTLTATTVNMAGGVAPVNGLLFGAPAGGVLPKLPAQTWSGINLATGTAGWFRQTGSVADTGALDSAGVVLRMDGAIASSGAEMNLNSTAFTAGATTTVATSTETAPPQ